MKMLTFKKGEVIFKQGDYANCMYDVVSGSVGVYVAYGTEAENRLTVLKVGEFLGEMGMIEAYPRSATAVALEDGTELREIGEVEFGDYFKTQPERLLAIMRQISGRLRDRTADYEGACAVLNGLKETQGEPEKRSQSLLERAKALIKFYNDVMAMAAATPQMNTGYYDYYINRF